MDSLDIGPHRPSWPEVSKSCPAQTCVGRGREGLQLVRVSAQAVPAFRLLSNF